MTLSDALEVIEEQKAVISVLTGRLQLLQRQLGHRPEDPGVTKEYDSETKLNEALARLLIEESEHGKTRDAFRDARVKAAHELLAEQHSHAATEDELRELRRVASGPRKNPKRTA